MRERIGHDIALCLPLQSIITDGCRCLNSQLDIAGLNDAPLFFRVVRPNACQAIGLQLDANLELIAASLIDTALNFLHSGQDAEQVLHMVAYFMRDHIGL